MKRTWGNSLLFKIFEIWSKKFFILWSFESLKFGAKSSSFYEHLNHYNVESKALHFMVLDSFTFTVTCFIFCSNLFFGYMSHKILPLTISVQLSNVM